MDLPGPPDAAVMVDFGLVAAEPVERTGRASIWKVCDALGRDAALKIYHRGMGNEDAGFDYLRDAEGPGLVRIYARRQAAVLLEWLEGPSLGDLSRAGRDEEACRELVAVATRLHAREAQVRKGYQALGGWFQALFDLRIAVECPAGLQADIGRAVALARGLLAAPREIGLLHGDLHHDNLRLGARGYCAFDAKGVIGERAYELANAFRNPNGAEALMRDRGRILRLAGMGAEALGVEKARLLDWAAVKCALSIAWRAEGDLAGDEEADLLGLLLDMAEG